MWYVSTFARRGYESTSNRIFVHFREPVIHFHVLLVILINPACNQTVFTEGQPPTFTDTLGIEI